jgi:argininosuccinate lyase
MTTHENGETPARGGFPDETYARTVLRPAFGHARELLFGPILAANVAHTIMLADCGIIREDDAAKLLAAIEEVQVEGPETLAYVPSVEDLFFAVEGRIIDRTGPDVGGNLQIARSRNDLDAAMCRLMLRARLLTFTERVLTLRRTLLGVARAHIETVMPGISHTQPAQPTTLAHYLMGVLGPLARDTRRLRELYPRVNRSPLGAAAFTTTGFPIDRAETARLLGFDGVVVNGYDAVGAGDHLVETVQRLHNLCASLARFTNDMLIWARQDVGYLRVGDAFIQISSRMPQQRHPVVFEHVRTRIGYVGGDAATVTAMVQGAAFGDTNDVEDPIYVPLARCVDHAQMVVDLLNAVFQTATFNTELMAQRVRDGLITTTELADRLVRDHRLSFRTAHHVVSSLVTASLNSGRPITAEQVNGTVASLTGREVALTDDDLRQALDPWAFVAARSIPGGPAPEAMARALADEAAAQADDATWLGAVTAHVNAAAALRADEVAQRVNLPDAR